MISQISPLATVKLDGSGNGQVSMGPPSGTKWQLSLATTSIANPVKQPQVFLYRGSSSGPLELIDSTYTGAQGSSGKVAGAPFFPGQLLWAVCKGGDAGATFTLQAYGQQGARSNPFDAPSSTGEGFANPVTAGTALVIPAINSPNYQAGAAGWTINADGTAEFNGATFRGTVDVIAPDGTEVRLAVANGTAAVLLDYPGDFSSATLFVYRNLDSGNNPSYALQIESGAASTQVPALMVLQSGTPLLAPSIVLGQGIEFMTVNTVQTTFVNGGSSLDLGAWTSYAGTLTSTGTNPTLGNSHFFTSYQMLNAKTCVVKFRLLVGGTWSPGSGDYLISLPFAAATDTDGKAEGVGSFWINDSGVAFRAGVLFFDTSTTAVKGAFNGTGTLVGASSQTWNNPDEYRGTIIYEIA